MCDSSGQHKLLAQQCVARVVLNTAANESLRLPLLHVCMLLALQAEAATSQRVTQA